MLRSPMRIAIPLTLLTALAVTMAPAAGAHRAAAAATLPSYAAPYPSTVTITAGAPLPAPIPANMTQQNNPLVSWVDKTLNVNINFILSAPAATYNQKVALALASGNMPDVMFVNATQMHQLADAGMIQDLSTAFKSFAPFQQEWYNANPQAIRAATINGKLMGFPNTNLDYQYDLLWVRQDWLDKLHLAAPKTVADVENVAKAFVQNKLGGDGTVGLMAPPGAGGLASLTAYNGMPGFDPLMQAYGAYQGDWIVQNGKVVYGSILPGMKDALAELHKLYAAGLIDQQFVSRTFNDELALLNNGKAGMFFGPWWMSYYPLNTAIANDPKANWVTYAAPLGVRSGKFEAIGPDPAGSFLVVRKGFAHPEAVAKINSIEQDAHDPVGAGLMPENPTPAYALTGIAADTQVVTKLQGAWTLWPLYTQVDPKDLLIRDYSVVQPYLQKHDRAGLVKAYGAGYAKWYDGVVAYRKHPDPVHDENDWQTYLAYTQGFATLATNLAITHEIQPLSYYPSPTMLQRWSILSKQEMQTFVAIIVGQQPLSAYDGFVHQWHALGGDKIQAELQQQYQQQLG